MTAALVSDAKGNISDKNKAAGEAGAQKQKEAPENQGPAKKDAPVRTQMRNVKFRFAINFGADQIPDGGAGTHR